MKMRTLPLVTILNITFLCVSLVDGAYYNSVINKAPVVNANPQQPGGNCLDCAEPQLATECAISAYCNDEFHIVAPTFTEKTDNGCTLLEATCSGYGDVMLWANGENNHHGFEIDYPQTYTNDSDLSKLLTVTAWYLCYEGKYVHNDRQYLPLPFVTYTDFFCQVQFLTPPTTPSPSTPSAPSETSEPSEPSEPSTPSTSSTSSEPSELSESSEPSELSESSEPSTPSTESTPSTQSEPSTPSTPKPSTPSTPKPTLAPTTTSKCCPVKGIWSDWDEVVSPCSDTCGGCGAMTRKRRCLSDSYGCKCSGPVQQMFPCGYSLCPAPRQMCCPTHPIKMLNTVTNTFYCGPLHFGEVVERTTCCDPAGQGWNLWSTWSPPCPETCGNCGIRTRSRTCGSEKYGCPCKGISEAIMRCSRPKPCAAPMAPCCPPSTLKRINGTNTCVF